jgi:hypothetical protein
MKNLELRHFAIEQTEARAEDATVTEKTLVGRAAVFGSESVDLGGFTESIAPGAFTRSLKEVDAGERNVAALWGHDWNQHLGSTRGGKLKLVESDKGLDFELDTTRFTPAQLDTARDNDGQMSFGFVVRADAWEEREDGSIHRTVTDVDLHEVSITPNPAYRATEASLRSLDAFKAEQAPAVVEADHDPTNRIALKLRALSKKLGYGERAMDTKQAEGFGIGDRVLIKNPHDPEQTMGTIKLISGDTPYGVVIDGMEEMGVHKWYIGEELEIIVEDESSDEDRKMKKKMPSMKMGKSH